LSVLLVETGAGSGELFDGESGVVAVDSFVSE
jgi:hypothetical protein